MKELNFRKSFLYVDNEGTKFCLMKGVSDNWLSMLSVQCFRNWKLQCRRTVGLHVLPPFHMGLTNLPEEIQKIWLTVVSWMILQTLYTRWLNRQHLQKRKWENGLNVSLQPPVEKEERCLLQFLQPWVSCRNKKRPRVTCFNFVKCMTASSNERLFLLK